MASKLIMDSESSSGGVSDAELFDMLFGMAPKNNSSNHSNSNNNLRSQLMTETEAPLSPCYNSSISEPGYGLIERCWEPGEIVDQDFEISTSLSSSSSPIRSYQDRYRHNKVRDLKINSPKHNSQKNEFDLFALKTEIYIQSAPNNSNETHTLMCLGRTGRFGQHYYCLEIQI